MKKRQEYSGFAEIYDLKMTDKLTRDTYREWRDELSLAIKKYKLKVKTLLDLCCGTGNTALPWVKKGYRVIGVDISKDMLRIARKKSKKVRWYHQDIVKLKIKEKAEVVTCHYASINHILSLKDLQKVFDNVYSVLNKGGLFIFDLIPENAIKWMGRKNRTFREGGDYRVISNKYDPKTKLLKCKQVWFRKKGKNYEKQVVSYTERAYSQKEIKQMLKKSGFKIIKVKIQKTPEWDEKPQRSIYLVRK